MDDLAQWLGEQLVEDERIARRATAQQRGGEAWAYVDSAVRAGSGLDVFKRTPPVFGEHVAEHDPARVLREIDAKRQALDEHQDVNDGSCGTCVDGQWGYPTHGGCSPQRYPCRTLRLLALPYADRPGYKAEWRP